MKLNIKGLGRRLGWRGFKGTPGMLVFLVVAFLGTGTATLASGCGGDAPPPVPSGAPVAAQGTPQPAPAAAQNDAGPPVDPTKGMAPLPLREFADKDFAETPSNRDPFRSYAKHFYEQAKTKVQIQRLVIAEKFALDELKLQGIVLGSERRVLLVDPTGYGWRPKVGDFVGRAEVVHSGGPTGTDVAINWRVDRIRDGDVVFVREDPSHPEIPQTTHVVALRTQEEEALMIHPTVN